MNIVQKTIQRVDDIQRAHKPTAFVFAVIKKFSDDQAGYQAALVTYYGFLSLFPLLLVLTTVAGIAGARDPALGHRLITSVSGYFPVVGKTLESSVNGVKGHGIALVLGLLFTLYGARGSADAFRNAVNHIWHIPLAQRSGFPRSLLRSFGLIFGAGAGFITAATVAGAANGFGHSWTFRLLTIALNLVILSLTFMLILRLSLPLGVPYKKFRVGAIVCGVGLTILQQLGTTLFTTHAKNLSPSGAIFATTLALLAWIYLQAQVVMYAVVVDTVRNKKLWPRSLSGNNPTKADEIIEKQRNQHEY